MSKTPTIVPKAIQLAGLDITVVRDNSLYETKKIIGEARYATQEIAIDCLTQRCVQSIEQNYCHELVHWLFFMSGEPELRTNERLVETMANFLHQALVSPKEYFTEGDLECGGAR